MTFWLPFLVGFGDVELNCTSILVKADIVSYFSRQAKKTDRQNHETRSLLGFPLRTELLDAHWATGLPHSLYSSRILIVYILSFLEI